MLNKKGEVELDAIVINGSDLSSGAVCAVQDIANPVQLARLVMEKVQTFVMRSLYGGLIYL